MQWTEYCQNLSAAVFHAPRQMSRAIKARELAPPPSRPHSRKFSSAVARQGTNGTGREARGANKRANSAHPIFSILRGGRGSSSYFLLIFSPSFFSFPVYLLYLPVIRTCLAILASREKLFDRWRMFDVPGIVETRSIDGFF